MWHDIGIAIALLLVIEGILPFLNPQGMKKTLLMMAQLNDRSLRTMGLVSMLFGVALLYMVN